MKRIIRFVEITLLLIPFLTLHACKEVGNGEPVKANAQSTSTPAAESNDYGITICIQFTSASDWNDLIILNPEVFHNYEKIDTWGEMSGYDISEKGISIGQDITNAEQVEEIGIIADFTLSDNNLPVEIRFLLEKGDLNVAKILVYETIDQEKILLKEIEHQNTPVDSDPNPLYFSVWVGVSSPDRIPEQKTTDAAGVIFHNGQILTMDADFQVAEAIAIKDGNIAAVGSDEEIMGLSDQEYEIIDLGGKTLMPAFVDAHNHLFKVDEQDYTSRQALALENGIATVGIMYVDEGVVDGLRDFDQQIGLKIRTNLYLVYDSACGDILGDWYTKYPPSQDTSEMLRIAGVKVFADGGSCNAPSVSFEYPEFGHGDLYFSQEQMNQLILNINNNGYQVAIHALRDLAVEQVLNAIETVSDSHANEMRNRIEHNSLVRADLLDHYDKSGAVATIFGAFPTCYFIGDKGNFKFVTPEELVHWEWRWREMLDANPGTVFAWHSDYPIFDINPIRNLYGFVVRRDISQDGKICEPPEWAKANRISVEEALRMMTYNGAYALFMEDVIGSLEPGKFADLIILSDNPLDVESEELKNLKVLITMVNGETEYCSPGFSDFCP